VAHLADKMTAFFRMDYPESAPSRGHLSVLALCPSKDRMSLQDQGRNRDRF